MEGGDFFGVNYQEEMIVIIALRVSRILSSLRCPATDKIQFLSAVNILLGRIKLSTGKSPQMPGVSYCPINRKTEKE
jgi:hypothetical protein